MGRKIVNILRDWKKIPSKSGPDWFPFSQGKSEKIRQKGIDKYSKSLDIVTFVKN